jgi:hypothetical protein
VKKRYQRERHKTSAQAAEPHVGIFWAVDDKPLIDSAPLPEAEPYGDHLTHPRSHIEVWSQFQSRGTAPAEMEYEEAPRGRVMYNTKTRRFALLADRCILRRKDLVAKIKSELHLPANTKLGTDSHYRCFTCLYGKDDEG